MKYLASALRHPRDYRWWALRPFQRHSLVLAVAGLVYIAFGSVLVGTVPSADRVSGLRLALAVAPLSVWGVLWIVAGCLAVVSARWPPASKTWGYSAMSGLAFCWAAMYLMGIVLLDAPISGASGALVWSLVGFLWWAIAGLMNPDDLLAHIADLTAATDDANGVGGE